MGYSEKIAQGHNVNDLSCRATGVVIRFWTVASGEMFGTSVALLVTPTTSLFRTKVNCLNIKGDRR